MASLDKTVLLPYQRAWIEDHAAMKIWLASRQIGKSFALSLEAVRESLASKCNNLILSSSERQSRESMQKVLSHLRVLKVASAGKLQTERENRGEVELPNGSRIISLPANPATVRGFSGNVYLDEFAFHEDSEGIWRAIYPTVTRGYKVRITSTANGKQNMFYRLWSDNENNMSRHRTSIHDAVKAGLVVDVDKLRKGLGDVDAWVQEYECAFLDSATALLTYDMLQSCESELATTSIGETLKGELYLGVDIGRRQDFTVFWLLERVGDVLWTRLIHTMRNASFSAQRDYLYALMAGMIIPLPAQPIRRCCSDATGLGMQLAEEAAQKFGSRVEPVVFTAATKEDMAITTRRRFEDRTVRIPVDREVREDLHAIRKVTTTAGNIRYDAARSEQGHADRFWALSLALHAASTPSGQPEYERVAGRALFGTDADSPRGRKTAPSFAGKGAF